LRADRAKRDGARVFQPAQVNGHAPVPRPVQPLMRRAGKPALR
jgi:hypothetical protein